jgi:methylthioribose-1-phosphate isomerase
LLPVRFLFGLASGVAVTILLTRKFQHDIRPAAKSALVSAMKALHGARAGSAELIEALEDLYAEAKDEATREIIAEAMAAARARAAAADKMAGETMASAGAEMPTGGKPSESTASSPAGKTRKPARKSSAPRKKATGNA